jgi:hypothetical protein
MFNLPHHIKSTIESIVQELEKIPEPRQLSVLAFIPSLDVSATPENHQVTNNIDAFGLKNQTQPTS